jgi:hypothetical protein
MLTVRSYPNHAALGKNETAFWFDIAAVAVKSLQSNEAAEAAAEPLTKKYAVSAPGREPKPSAAEDWKILYKRLAR